MAGRYEIVWKEKRELYAWVLSVSTAPHVTKQLNEKQIFDYKELKRKIKEKEGLGIKDDGEQDDEFITTFESEAEKKERKKAQVSQKLKMLLAKEAEEAKKEGA